MRKIYSSLKAEVANIDRKRKRLKKKRGIVDIMIHFLLSTWYGNYFALFRLCSA